MRVSPPAQRALLVAGFVAVGALRVGLALRPPAETTDVLRNLVYGRAFWQHGFQVYDRTPVELAPDPDLTLLWGTHTYDYPAAALFFFAILAAISTSLVVARLVLSGIELVNALLVMRLTGSRTAGLLWFAGPASLWWVSGEGQFEPVAVLFSLLAIDALGRGRDIEGWVWLAAAIQTKILPLLLVPWFLWRRPRPLAAAAFVLAMTPSLAATHTSSYLARMFEPGYWPEGFNAFAWSVSSVPPRQWLPWPIAWGDALLSSALLIGALLLARGALRRGAWDEALATLPLIVFLAVLKSVGWGQCWYLLLAPAFAAAIREPRARVLLLLLPLLEWRGTSALLVGPVGMVQWFPMWRYLHGGW